MIALCIIISLTAILISAILLFAGIDIVERLERIAVALEQINKKQR